MSVRFPERTRIHLARRCIGRRERNGVILLIVLVVVAAFSVAAYAMSHQMLTELAVVKATNQISQQRLLAESAIERLLSSDTDDLAALTHSPIRDNANSNSSHPAIHMGLAIQAVNSSENLGYSVVLRTIPVPGKPVQYGLNNQSAKLNLNSLTVDRYNRRQVMEKLMRYPNLSEATAAGIADLLGIFAVDNEPASTSAKKLPLGGTLTSLRQLLEVPGVTESLLFGEDLNANGLLDSSENDGDRSFPPDNENGRLDSGWSAHWTLTGSESNMRCTESNIVRRKVNLNQPDLARLYDQLLEFATPAQAKFVVAWRQSAPIYTDSTSESNQPTAEEIIEERKKSVKDRIAMQMGVSENPFANSQPQRSSTADNMRAGLDLATPGNRMFSSLLDLASCQLQLIMEGEDNILVSPFANDPTSLRRWLPLWESQTCLTEGPTTIGRINIMQASKETLATVDGISPELAKQIVAQRATFNPRSTNADSQPQTVGWLNEAGLVSTSELRNIHDEITMGGCVFTGVALGQLNRSRTASAISIEIDGRGPTPQLRHSQDLPPLTYPQRITFP